MIKDNEKSASQYRKIVKELHLAISKVEMYGRSHPIAKTNLNQAYSLFAESFNQINSLTLYVSDEGRLYADGNILPADTFEQLFGRNLQRRNIDSISFDRRMTLDEFEYFVDYFTQAKNVELAEYLHRGNSTSITANSIEYRLVATGDGGEVNPPERELPSRDFLPASAKGILEELSELSEEVLIYLSDQGLIRTIGEIMFREGTDTLSIQALDAMIDSHSRILEPTHAHELTKWYDRLREKHLAKRPVDKPQTSSEGRAEFVENLDKFLIALSGGLTPHESRRKLASLLGNPIEKASLEELEVMFKYLLSTFMRFPTPAFLIVPEVFVGLMFEKVDSGIINNFTKNRLAEKARERSSGFETEFATTTLVWLTANYLSRGKLLPALNIARLYNRRRSDNRLSNGLIEDAKTYFASLCVGAPLESLVEAVNIDFFGVPPEVEELIQLIDSQCIQMRFIEEMSDKPKDYAIKVAGILRYDPDKSAKVIAREIMSIIKQQRNSSGALLQEGQRKKLTNAMFALAIIAGNSTLPLLTAVAEDNDPAVRDASIEAIAKVGTEEAARILVKFLYKEKSKWREEVFRLLPRMDPDLVLPVLERFFHSRREYWIDIIRVVGMLESPQALAFLVDTLYMWNSYTSAMNSYKTEEFITALLDSIANFELNDEARDALKAFIDEWHHFDILRGIKVLLGSRRDLVTEKAKRLISL